MGARTKDNRDKRKALQERRNAPAKQLQFLQQSSAEAQQVMQQLYANVEKNLALAAHAEKWEWKEIAPDQSPSEEESASTTSSEQTTDSMISGGGD